MSNDIIIKKLQDLEKIILNILPAQQNQQTDKAQAKIFTAKIAQNLILTYAQNNGISPLKQVDSAKKAGADLIEEFKHSTEFNKKLTEIQSELTDLSGLIYLSQSAVQLLGQPMDSSLAQAFSKYQEKKNLQKELLSDLTDFLLFVAVVIVLALCTVSPYNIDLNPALLIAGTLLAILVKTFEYVLDQQNPYRKDTISAILAQQQSAIHIGLKEPANKEKIEEKIHLGLAFNLC